MKVTYGAGFAPVVSMRKAVDRLQIEISKHPQYEPITEHLFHGGMYCRKVWRAADVTIVGKVHKKEHFYMVVHGTVLITTDDGIQRVIGPQVLCSKPGTKRAVYSETDALCMTFHRTDSTTVEEAETELVEYDATSMFLTGNKVQNKELS